MPGGNGGDEPLGVWVPGMAEHRLDVPLLHQHAPLHHRRAGAELPHHVQVVGDEQHGDAGLPVQLFQKLQNLGLDGHVQGGGGLIQQQQLGPCHDGRGDHGPLQHPAGELVGILPIHARRVRQLHCCQGRQGLVPPRLPGEVCVDTQHLLHLGADTHQGVHAALGFLKHHADLRSLNLPQNGPVRVEQFLPVQQDAAGIVALLPGQQPCHAHGSDGFSGITANPLVGKFSDILIGKGGTTILTEVPEMFGAETILMNRCQTPELFDKTVCLINDFKNYFTSHNQTIYENPSPGNKKGGISTLEDKSLGCTQKSGSAPVKGVLAYGEQVKTKGLNLLSAPGNDLVASTALAVSGAQIVLFTTGRGTPFASPVPTVKISSNSALAGKKNNWIDFNAGRMVEDKSKEELAKELFEYVLAVASGKKVKAEEAGFHDMAIFKQGVTL